MRHTNPNLLCPMRATVVGRVDLAALSGAWRTFSVIAFTGPCQGSARILSPPGLGVPVGDGAASAPGGRPFASPAQRDLFALSPIPAVSTLGL